MLVTVVDEAFDDDAVVFTLALSSSVDSRVSSAEPNDELLISSVPLSALKKSSESKLISVMCIARFSSVTVDDISLASSWIVSAILDFVVSMTDAVPKYLRMRMAALSSGMPDVSSTGFSLFFSGCLLTAKGDDGAEENGFCIDWIVERNRPQLTLLTLLTLDTERSDSVLSFLPHSATLADLSGRELSNVCTKSLTWCCSNNSSSESKQQVIHHTII